MKQFLMGNEAIALGAIHAGVNLVCGYPGTPSTEILESAARMNPGHIYIEWSVNEKAALEVAAGAAYAGGRTLVTMKQVGLNVASDPLMSLAYVGTKGGMVICVADDPGPISSQTEQDTRAFAGYAHLPVFDPSSPQEAYDMIGEAFRYSEKYETPVLFRPTTRVCHGCADVVVSDEGITHTPSGFVKDTNKWVIFPRSSYLNHIKLVEREPVLSKDFSAYPRNQIEGDKDATLGIVTGGVSHAYVKEVLQNFHFPYRLLKVATPYPFPREMATDFLNGLRRVIVFEELEPVLERELLCLAGEKKLQTEICGKLTKHTPIAGENTVEDIQKILCAFFGVKQDETSAPLLPSLPVRPPVLCAGCPHRASFYAVKKATHGEKAVYSGDIGCYTLGNAKPLDMVDTCLCMGADVTIAQGLQRMEPDVFHFAFIGDSTFFASGIPGVINAVYNETDIILVVLDNATTAMTGRQPHPGTGVTMMGKEKQKLDIKRILEAIGVRVFSANPLKHTEAVETVKAAMAASGVRAVLFTSPCAAAGKASSCFRITDACIGCKKCIREIGCPAISVQDDKVEISTSLCTGCGLCTQICPTNAISEVQHG